MSTICINCNNEIPDDSASCPECGSPAEPQDSISCPECSKLVVFSADACPECGFPRELLTAGLESVPFDTSDGQSHPEIKDAAESPVGDSEPHPSDNEGQRLDSMVATIATLMQASEKAHEELINKMKEQNLMAVSGIQELLSTFSNEMKAESEKMNAAHVSASAEITAMTKQAKEQIQQVASKISLKSGNIADYTLYICAAVLMFSLINLFVTAYIVRMIK
jgi:RNA polymerase subunit RPABC4/transcription elongation factor Spt4